MLSGFACKFFDAFCVVKNRNLIFGNNGFLKLKNNDLLKFEFYAFQGSKIQNLTVFPKFKNSNFEL